MFRIKMLLATLAAVVTALIAVPAHADGEHATNFECIKYDGSADLGQGDKESCLRVRWDKQNDGTGVQLEYMAFETRDGCYDLPSPKYKYVTAKFFWFNVTIKTWDWAGEPCNFTKDFSAISGLDDGSMDYRLQMCGGDDLLVYRVRMQPGGGYTWLDSYHTSHHANCT